ncbi:MAG TPA: hypothetical protein VNT99_19095 [Methylomirabilota bacterium]|nr:hypothetical protein [Methylomirabilota bacterium]
MKSAPPCGHRLAVVAPVCDDAMLVMDAGGDDPLTGHRPGKSAVCVWQRKD